MQNKLRSLIRTMVDEITATGDVEGYSTPNAFSKKRNDKKNKKIATNSTNFKPISRR